MVELLAMLIDVLIPFQGNSGEYVALVVTVA
jgi:hypothetical protein